MYSFIKKKKQKQKKKTKKEREMHNDGVIVLLEEKWLLSIGS